MDTEKLPWQPLRENVFHKHLARDESKKFQVDLIKLEPNVKFKEHSHPDVEWIYVLKGKMSDERGTYSKNDFIVNEKGSKHSVTSGKEGCEILCCWCGELK